MLVSTIKLLFKVSLLGTAADGYHLAPCEKVSVRRQFQFSDCYVPNLNTDLYLNQASFVMAHDTATGYLNINNNDDADGNGNSNNNQAGGVYSNEYDGVDNMNNAVYQGGDNDNNQYSNNAAHPSRWNTVTTRLLSLYGKTQVGTVYDQLNDGARALDLRPKIYNNGTIGFHHGSLIDVPLNSITLGGLLDDAKQWANDNPKELVLIFHSELVHEAGYNGLSSQVYIEADDDYMQTDDTDDNNDDYDADDGGGGDDNAGNDGEDDAANAEENNDGDGNGNDDGTYQEYEYYYSGIARMKDVYKQKGIPYYPCEKLAGLTVGQAMDMADLTKTGGKGYLIAVDRHDMYGELISVDLLICLLLLVDLTFYHAYVLTICSFTSSVWVTLGSLILW